MDNTERDNSSGEEPDVDTFSTTCMYEDIAEVVREYEFLSQKYGEDNLFDMLNDGMEAAASAEKPEIITFLASKGCRNTNTSIPTACQTGSIETVQALINTLELPFSNFSHHGEALEEAAQKSLALTRLILDRFSADLSYSDLEKAWLIAQDAENEDNEDREEIIALLRERMNNVGEQ